MAEIAGPKWLPSPHAYTWGRVISCHAELDQFWNALIISEDAIQSAIYADHRNQCERDWCDVERFFSRVVWLDTISVIRVSSVFGFAGRGSFAVGGPGKSWRWPIMITKTKQNRDKMRTLIGWWNTVANSANSAAYSWLNWKSCCCCCCCCCNKQQTPRVQQYTNRLMMPCAHRRLRVSGSTGQRYRGHISHTVVQ